MKTPVPILKMEIGGRRLNPEKENIVFFNKNSAKKVIEQSITL